MEAEGGGGWGMDWVVGGKGPLPVGVARVMGGVEGAGVG